MSTRWRVVGAILLGLSGCEDCDDLDAEVERIKANILRAAAIDGIAAPCETQPTPSYAQACDDYARAKQRADECHGK
jgi:hypothetical protein